MRIISNPKKIKKMTGIKKFGSFEVQLTVEELESAVYGILEYRDILNFNLIKSVSVVLK